MEGRKESGIFPSDGTKLAPSALAPRATRIGWVYKISACIGFFYHHNAAVKQRGSCAMAVTLYSACGGIFSIGTA